MFTGFSVLIRDNTVITLVKKDTFSSTRGATLAEVFDRPGRFRETRYLGLVIVINIIVISLVGARLGRWLRR